MIWTPRPERDEALDVLHFLSCGLPLEEAEFAARHIVEALACCSRLVWNTRVNQVQMRAYPDLYMVTLFDWRSGLRNAKIPSLT
jgi:hypothetical protein